MKKLELVCWVDSRERLLFDDDCRNPLMKVELFGTNWIERRLVKMTELAPLEMMARQPGAYFGIRCG